MHLWKSKIINHTKKKWSKTKAKNKRRRSKVKDIIKDQRSKTHEWSKTEIKDKGQRQRSKVEKIKYEKLNSAPERMHSKKSPVNVEDIVVSIDRRHDEGHIISVRSPSRNHATTNAYRHNQEKNYYEFGNLHNQRRNGEFFDRINVVTNFILLDVLLHVRIQREAP